MTRFAPCWHFRCACHSIYVHKPTLLSIFFHALAIISSRTLLSPKMCPKPFFVFFLLSKISMSKKYPSPIWIKQFQLERDRCLSLSQWFNCKWMVVDRMFDCTCVHIPFRRKLRFIYDHQWLYDEKFSFLFVLNDPYRNKIHKNKWIRFFGFLFYVFLGFVLAASIFDETFVDNNSTRTERNHFLVAQNYAACRADSKCVYLSKFGI